MRGDSNKREHPSRENQLLKSHSSTRVIFSPSESQRGDVEEGGVVFPEEIRDEWTEPLPCENKGNPA